MTPADKGLQWEVIWHPEAERERDRCYPGPEIDAINNAVEKLEAVGATLRHPHSSAVRGADIEGLRELRPRAGRSRWRPLYVQVGARTFLIVVVAPEAQIDKRGFKTAIKRAEQRLADIELD